VALVTAGRDHLTHRLRMKLGSPAAVAAVLALTQAAVSALAIAAARIGRTSIIVAATACLCAGAALVALLDSPLWTSGRARRATPYENRDRRSTSDA
jgi:hypothetical protein